MILVIFVAFINQSGLYSYVPILFDKALSQMNDGQNTGWADEMAQGVKLSALKTEDVSLFQNPYERMRDSTSANCLLSSTYALCYHTHTAHMHACATKQITINVI